MKNHIYQIPPRFLFSLLICLFAFSQVSFSQGTAIKCGDDERVKDDLGTVIITAGSAEEAQTKYQNRVLRKAQGNGYSCDPSDCDLDTDFCTMQFDGWANDDYEPPATDNGDGTFTFPPVTMNYDISCTECTDTTTKVVLVAYHINDWGEPIQPKMVMPGNGPIDQGGQLVHDIYPNPASTLINVELQTQKGSADIRMVVANANGQEVINKLVGAIPGGNYLTELDVESLSPGMYFLSIIDGGQQKDTFKFVVRK